MNPQPKQTTYRNSKYMVWLRGKPCTLCGTESYYNAGHHTETGGMGLKCDDRLAVPVCIDCHREIHTKMSKKGPWSDDQLQEITSKLMEKFLKG